MRTLRKGNKLTVTGKRYSLTVEKRGPTYFEIQLFELETSQLRVHLNGKNFRVMLTHVCKLKKHLK